jgi:hypothetical protein
MSVAIENKNGIFNLSKISEIEKKTHLSKLSKTFKYLCWKEKK